MTAVVIALAWAPAAWGQDAAPARLIVKLKADGPKARVPLDARLRTVGEEARLPLRYTRPMALGLAVVEVDGSAASADAVAAEVALHPDVEWAEPDRIKRPAFVPNDALTSAYLNASSGGINAFGAWDVTTGSATTVIAVVDTGVLPHPDLAGRTLVGYDFISNVLTANDGDGRDPDPTDPGDWVAEGDSLPFTSCATDNSSWHGTGVAGIIGANTNNKIWVAGLDWQAKIIPVRVLGKCGGFTSDIIDGVAWAAGLRVPGVPDNPSPAQIINLSLGGPGPCSGGEQAVFDAVLTAGSAKAIVIAAGNASDDVTGYSPANCLGVIRVASTSAGGSLARYSNFGAGITVSAPGGQFRPSAGDFGILVLSNSGAKTAQTMSFRNSGGTSLAAPMVTGTIALMLAVNPDLDAARIQSILAATVSPFPATSTCTSALCGPGIVNALHAVQAAQALAPKVVQVVEFYNPSLDHFFITWLPAEIAALDVGTTIKGWQRTQVSFKAYVGTKPETSPVCRYYMPPLYGDSHFFGRGATECAQTGTKNPGFVLEDPDFMDMYLPVGGTCRAGTQPIYRVFSNRADANHRYMTDRTLRDVMVTFGWASEGDGPDQVVMCAPM